MAQEAQKISSRLWGDPVLRLLCFFVATQDSRICSRDEVIDVPSWVATSGKAPRRPDGLAAHSRTGVPPGFARDRSSVASRAPPALGSRPRHA
jgi:hypothetical protein